MTIVTLFRLCQIPSCIKYTLEKATKLAHYVLVYQEQFGNLNYFIVSWAEHLAQVRFRMLAQPLHSIFSWGGGCKKPSLTSKKHNVPCKLGFIWRFHQFVWISIKPNSIWTASRYYGYSLSISSMVDFGSNILLIWAQRCSAEALLDHRTKYGAAQLSLLLFSWFTTILTSHK